MTRTIRTIDEVLTAAGTTRKDVAAELAQAAIEPNMGRPTPAPRAPVAYDPAHPDRDPTVLQGYPVLTPEQQQRLRNLSPEAYRRWREATQPYTNEDT